MADVPPAGGSIGSTVQPPAPASSSANDNADHESSSLLKSADKNADLHRALAKDDVELTKRRPWGYEEASDSDSDDEEDKATTRKQKKLQRKAVLTLCLFILCVFVAMVVAGAWLAADVKKSGDVSGKQIAGYALLTVAGILLFFFILGCCMICCTSCLASVGSWNNNDFKEFDPNDIHQRRTRPRFIFKHWNDEFYMDASQHESLLAITARGLPKEARTELKKAQKAHLEAEKKRKAELNKLVVERVKNELKQENVDPVNVIRKLRKRVYVIDFDVAKGADVDNLALQVSLVVKVGTPGNDVVVFRITSPGGYVSQYGLAASQILRLRNLGFRTIACIDNMAASGGYMMACVCDEICAAPFAFVGSIGVITYVPNLDRVTKETLKVDVYRFTAGKYKRTVDMFGEVTEEDKAKLISELQIIHDEFKDHVKKHRGSKLKVNIDEVATGEGWLATNAFPYGLVDRLVTSDQVLLEFTKEYDVLVITEFKKTKESLLKELLAADSSVSAIRSLLPESLKRLIGVQPPAQLNPGHQLIANEGAQAVADFV